MQRQRAGGSACSLASSACEQRAAVVVFVAQVEVAGLDAHHLRGDQQAFEEAVRIAFEVGAVLEGAGLALVDVDRHQPRARAGRARCATCARPESRRRPARAGPSPPCAEDCLGVLLAVDQRGGQRIAAVRAVGGVVGVGRLASIASGSGETLRSASRPGRSRIGRCDRLRTRARAAHRLQHLVGVASGTARWCTATAGACSQRPMQGAGDHAHIARPAAQQGRQPRQQILRAGHFARQAVAHPHREAGRRLVAAHDLEVVIEGRDLEHLGHRDVHLLRQRHQVVVMQAAVARR